MEGLKISLEGIDGVGKTTQLPYIAQYLEEQGFDVLVKPCRNNDQGSGLDADILHMLKGSPVVKANPATEALLAAARISYIDYHTVNPHLENGGVVLADRDIDTAVAYAAPDLNRRHPELTPRRVTKWLFDLYSLNHVIPHSTLYLHAEPIVALRRAIDDDIPNERAIFTDANLNYMRIVQAGYRQLRDMFPERIKEIDVNDMSITEVSTAIRAHVDGFLNERVLHG